jgi:hypothetical protein
MLPAFAVNLDRRQQWRALLLGFLGALAVLIAAYLLDAMRNHVLAEAQLMGKYKR